MYGRDKANLFPQGKIKKSLDLSEHISDAKLSVPNKTEITAANCVELGTKWPTKMEITALTPSCPSI